MRIPVTQPSITQAEVDAVNDALKKGQISGIPHNEYIQKFEQAFAERIGREFCFAVTNGTHAVEAVLRVLGIGHDHEVIVPAWTFAAPANAVLYTGATPVYADIDPENWTISIDEIKRLITPRTRAVIGVDIFAHPCDFDAMKVALWGADIDIIEDAAQAHGSKYKGRYCGDFGGFSTFSFFANKSLALGEGGAILTDYLDMAEPLRLIKNHGMTEGYNHVMVGSNYRMTSLHAAIGYVQVQRWDYLIAERERVARTYDTHLPEELGRRPVSSWAQPATWLVVVTHPERDRLVAGLRAQGIDARPTWKSLDQFPIYAAGVRGEYPVANKVAAETFVLPTYPDLDDQTIIEICRMLEDLL